jgi:hypothetical protein
MSYVLPQSVSSKFASLPSYDLASPPPPSSISKFAPSARIYSSCGVWWQSYADEEANLLLTDWGRGEDGREYSMNYRGSTSTNRDKYTDQERGGGGVSKKFLSKVLFYRRDAKSVVNDLLDGPNFSWIYDLAPSPPPSR